VILSSLSLAADVGATWILPRTAISQSHVFQYYIGASIVIKVKQGSGVCQPPIFFIIHMVSIN